MADEEDWYKQNYQVCILDKTGMWCKIKEFCFKWSETEPYGSEIDYIGLKLMFFRRPIDKNIKKKLNFIPLY